LPMFLLSHHVSTKKLSASYYLINFGLLLFAADQLFFHTKFQVLYGLMIGIGILLFGLFVLNAYRKRVRKTQDAGMKQSLIAVVLMALPIVLMIAVSELFTLPEKLRLQLYLVYGISVFMGFISALILGQTFKTLPFIVWLNRYQHLAGKMPIPQPKDLYSEKLVQIQNFVYAVGFIILVIGTALFQRETILFGGSLMVLTAVLYNVNVFKMVWLVFQKPPVIPEKTVAKTAEKATSANR